MELADLAVDVPGYLLCSLVLVCICGCCFAGWMDEGLRGVCSGFVPEVFLVINGPAQAGGAPLPFVVCSKLCVRSRL